MPISSFYFYRKWHVSTKVKCVCHSFVNLGFIFIESYSLASKRLGRETRACLPHKLSKALHNHKEQSTHMSSDRGKWWFGSWQSLLSISSSKSLLSVWERKGSYSWHKSKHHTQCILDKCHKSIICVGQDTGLALEDPLPEDE